MKKILLLLLCNFCLFNVLTAQEEIIIDWQKLDIITKNKKLLEPVEFGNFHTFKIENINKFLYQVTILGKNVELETPVPSELQALFRLTKEELNATAVTPEVDTALEEVTNSKMLDAYKNGTKLTTAINTYEEELLKLKKQLFQLKMKRIDLVLLAQSDVSYAKMKDLVDDVNAKYTITALKFNTPSAFDKMVQEKKAVQVEFISEMNSIKASKSFAKANKKNEIDLLDTKMESIMDAVKTIDESSLFTLYSEVAFLERELVNVNNFTVIAPPVQADSDFINFKVNATPVQTNTLAAHKSVTDFSFDVPVTGGLKVDFSVGPVFSFGKGAKDEKYYLETSTTDGISVLRERDNNNVMNPGVGAFMHIYKRTGTNTSLGGLFGVGAGFQSIDDANLSFYLGGTLVMGKQQKIMLNAGVSFLTVERLKESEFVVGDEYATTDFDLGNVTEKVFKASLFLSITYNLTNRVER